jgi:ATP-dependent Clp protease ATP-binding subunit ClpA
MFERFTAEAREVVTGAQDEARRLRHPFIGAEHLLVSMAGGTGPGAQVLHARGLTQEILRSRLTAFTNDDLDAEALSALGIDLERVREATEANLGPGALDPKRPPMPRGHIPFAKQGKKVLELSLREALRLKSREIDSGHVLLGILREAESRDDDDVTVRLLTDGGVQLDALRSETERLIANRAA